MFQYTYNNHFKFGYLQKSSDNKYVENFYANRNSEADDWIVKYGQCEKNVSDFRTECIRAAQKIYDNRQGLKIDVLFSGGSDSEIVLRSFLELGVDFNVHIMRFDDYLNAHDWSYAYVICQNLNIKPIFHDLNLLKFWRTEEFRNFTWLSKCVSPQLVPHMWLMNRVDGLAIMGSGECYTARVDIVENRSTNFDNTNYSKHVPWVLYEREKIASWYRFPMARNQPAVPGFFQYTPEIMYSFLVDETSLLLHSNQHIGKLSNKGSKFNIYKKYWPELVDRKKWSGFEKVLEHDRVLREEMRNSFGIYEYEYWSQVNYLIAYLSGIESTSPINSSPKHRNPGLKGVTMASIKQDLGTYLD